MNATSPFQAAWYERFKDMPTIPGCSILGAMDGDIAWLHELRRSIGDHPRRRVLNPLPHDFIYYTIVLETNVVPTLLGWDDPAAELLAAWKAGR